MKKPFWRAMNAWVNCTLGKVDGQRLKEAKWLDVITTDNHSMFMQGKYVMPVIVK